VHRPLESKRVVVTGTSAHLGLGILAALDDAGATTYAVPDDQLLSTRERAADALARVVEESGYGVDAVVHTAMPAIAFEQIDFVDVDDSRWAAVWEGVMQSTLFVLQAAFAQLRDRGGSIVLLTPTVSMSGAARLVPYTVAVEGQRLLAKSAARQWGPDGIRVNCVAPAPEHVPIGVDSMTVSLAPPALGGPGDVTHDVGAVAVWLVSDAAHFVTGVTVCADGGVWMAP
jgi:3-oxoacyl-[acyl-carrier protein] reductase